MQELTMTPATVVVLIVLAAVVVWAVRRIVRRGLCDCNDHCGDCKSAGCKGSCSACTQGIVDKMIADAGEAAKPSERGGSS